MELGTDSFRTVRRARWLPWLVAGAASLVVAVGAVRAADAEPSVAVALTQVKVERDGERERLMPAEKFSPGDVVEYEATYTNSSKAPVRRLMATLPIEEGLIYMPKSATPQTGKLLVAARDGRFAAEPLMRVAQGASKPEPVPYEEYRAVRWEIDKLDPGASIKVKVRARVTPMAEAVAAVSKGDPSKVPGKAP